MFIQMYVWFLDLKVPYKGNNMEVISEGSDDSRFLDKGTESISIHFQLLSFL